QSLSFPSVCSGGRIRSAVAACGRFPRRGSRSARWRSPQSASTDPPSGGTGQVGERRFSGGNCSTCLRRYSGKHFGKGHTSNKAFFSFPELGLGVFVALTWWQPNGRHSSSGTGGKGGPPHCQHAGNLGACQAPPQRPTLHCSLQFLLSAEYAAK